VDAETIKNAIANSPQLVTQIETILLTGTSEEKVQKIMALISQAKDGDTTPNQGGNTTPNK
jgi:hypothetical protein